jgi:hypothetical protein
MTCPLTEARLSALLRGEVQAAELELLRQHLAGDCEECEAQLDRAGLDEEALLLCLQAAAQPAVGPADVARLATGPDREAATPSAARGLAKVLAFRPRLRRPHTPWAGMGLGLAACAATLFLMLRPEAPTEDGVKGEAPLPQLELLLLSGGGPLAAEVPETTIAELRTTLDRDAHVAVLAVRPGHAPMLVFNDRLAAGVNAAVPAAGGSLGYEYAGELGPHLFVALVADRPILAADAVDAAAKELAASRSGWHEVTLGGQRVGVRTVRVQVVRHASP